VAEVERLWRAGQREEAADAVPIDLGFRTNLVGTEATVAERISRYRDAGITTLLAKLDTSSAESITSLTTLVRLAHEQ